MLTSIMEAVFNNKRSRKSGKFSPPPPLPGISVSTPLKYLVSHSQMISQSEITCMHSSASQPQTHYALRAYEYWTMPPYKQCFARSGFQSCSTLCVRGGHWWRFSTVVDRQKKNAFIHRNARSGFVPADLPEFEEICRTADEKLFHSIIPSAITYSWWKIILQYHHISNHNRVLFRLLPHLKTIILGIDFITCKYRRDLTIWMTVTLSIECFMLTYFNYSKFSDSIALWQLS